MSSVINLIYAGQLVLDNKSNIFSLETIVVLNIRLGWISDIKELTNLLCRGSTYNI